MSIKDSIDNSIGLEDRSPQSTRLFTKIAILSSSIALLLFLICLIAYQIDKIVGLNIFASIFIPNIILFLIAFYLALAERLRAKYMSARIALIISCLVFISIVSFLIFEYIRYGAIFIAPFNPVPTEIP